MRFISTCACSASRSRRQCSPEYFSVSFRRCKSRVPTFRKRSEKLDEARREVVRQSRFRQALIVVEVALSVVLLAGAGLLFRSFLRLQSVNTGFVSQQVLTARLTPSGTNYVNHADFAKFYNQVIEKVSADSRCAGCRAHQYAAFI